jgi:hypothetical protein
MSSKTKVQLTSEQMSEATRAAFELDPSEEGVNWVVEDGQICWFLRQIPFEGFETKRKKKLNDLQNAKLELAALKEKENINSNINIELSLSKEIQIAESKCANLIKDFKILQLKQRLSILELAARLKEIDDFETNVEVLELKQRLSIVESKIVS